MNKELKFKQSDDQKIYGVSDTHLNHNREFIWGARGYPDSKSHTDGVINSINDNVRANDILLHLGDICLNTDESGFNNLLGRINCQNIYMLWGNHNNPTWRVYQNAIKEEYGRDDIEIYPFRYRNVIFIGNYAEALLDGHLFVLHHYPIYVFNYMKDGAKHLCGHSHYGLEFSKATNLKSKILDIGWDGFKKPLSLNEILAIMDTKEVFDAGDHHTRTKVNL
jgi:calcineurin-like phosphoesterase family protein